MTLEELSAKQAITEALYRYCRSMDRMDAELYRSVFTFDADLVYADYFQGTMEDFKDWVWEAHARMQTHSHQITNILIELEPSGDRAVSESYVTVCLRTKPEGGRVTDIVDRGRYLDKWVKGEDGEWRIIEREFLDDVQQVIDASHLPEPEVARDRSDPSYELFGVA